MKKAWCDKRKERATKCNREREGEEEERSCCSRTRNKSKAIQQIEQEGKATEGRERERAEERSQWERERDRESPASCTSRCKRIHHGDHYELRPRDEPTGHRLRDQAQATQRQKVSEKAATRRRGARLPVPTTSRCVCVWESVLLVDWLQSESEPDCLVPCQPHAAASICGLLAASIGVIQAGVWRWGQVLPVADKWCAPERSRGCYWSFCFDY